MILTEEEENLLEAGQDPFVGKRNGDKQHDSLYVHSVEYGFIAQDVYKTPKLQNCVIKGDENTLWAIKYEQLSVLAIGAIQQLKNEIDILKAKL